MFAHQSEYLITSYSIYMQIMNQVIVLNLGGPLDLKNT